ncbi:hypothetical protein HYG77_33715 (plasmid) [Rhodococcus sp. ZPP]|uniref:hypothetical protein n=1 Tax=unclassified Rhodococcus (in: high G+C Gram-positive bacteria) TaxID=192944 RepID=UPI001AD8655A|nr:MULTISPECIES: hypothetical protein [unclassified Rhodococcus (in: high G+C Gram-positive bacteria)]QTJ70482.1 hypothetical protein HYG77_33715 [Rhodococcus sp. ZPP]
MREVTNSRVDPDVAVLAFVSKAPDAPRGRMVVVMETGSASLDEVCDSWGTAISSTPSDEGAAAAVKDANKAGCDIAIVE